MLRRRRYGAGAGAGVCTGLCALWLVGKRLCLPKALYSVCAGRILVR